MYFNLCYYFSSTSETKFPWQEPGLTNEQLWDIFDATKGKDEGRKEYNARKQARQRFKKKQGKIQKQKEDSSKATSTESETTHTTQTVTTSTSSTQGQCSTSTGATGQFDNTGQLSHTERVPQLSQSFQQSSYPQYGMNTELGNQTYPPSSTPSYQTASAYAYGCPYRPLQEVIGYHTDPVTQRMYYVTPAESEQNRLTNQQNSHLRHANMLPPGPPPVVTTPPYAQQMPHQQAAHPMNVQHQQPSYPQQGHFQPPQQQRNQYQQSNPYMYNPTSVGGQVPQQNIQTPLVSSLHTPTAMQADPGNGDEDEEEEEEEDDEESESTIQENTDSDEDKKESQEYTLVESVGGSQPHQTVSSGPPVSVYTDARVSVSTDNPLSVSNSENVSQSKRLDILPGESGVAVSMSETVGDSEPHTTVSSPCDSQTRGTVSSQPELPVSISEPMMTSTPVKESESQSSHVFSGVPGSPIRGKDANISIISDQCK